MTVYGVPWCLVFTLTSWSLAMFAFGYSIGRAGRMARKLERERGVAPRGVVLDVPAMPIRK
jgi:hypothetical protein